MEESSDDDALELGDDLAGNLDDANDTTGGKDIWQTDEGDDVDADITEFFANVAIGGLLEPHELPDPQHRKEALSAPDAKEFLKAEDKELDGLASADTYDIVDISEVPKDAKLITSRFVYKRKIGYDSKVKTYKARLVAQGFQQQEGIDYAETFAAVVKPPSFRTLFALAAVLGWKVHQIDVMAAFLNGKLEHYVYIKPPPGMKLPQNKILRLKHALYGLKQAPHT